MTNTIEATANSIKLSYLRFVSDSAPGLLLVLALAVLDSHGLLAVRIIPHDATDKAIGAIAVVLLATPIGLLINGAGHFLLGDLQRWIDRQCFAVRGWPIKDTRQTLLIDKWEVFFDVQPGDWPRVAHEVDELLDTLVPHLAASLDHVRALKKFCRSIAFLAAVTAFVVIGDWGAVTAAGLIGGMAILSITSSGRWRKGGIAIVGVSLLAVFILCGIKSLPVTVALLLSGAGFLLLAGLVDFYQHGMTMLFVYQLLVFDGGSFKITPAEVRKRLTLFIRSLKTDSGTHAELE
jgi:hypothetical protein